MAVDGVNLRVFGVCPSMWLNSQELGEKFETKVNHKTGKPIDGTKKATYKGLRFEITSKPFGGYGMSIKGSLHKYFNDGLHNSNQFYYSDLVKVIHDLKTRFGLCLDTVIIENIEIGVNLTLPFEVAKVLTSLISYSDKTFEAMDGKNPMLGRICSSFDFDIKIYDKLAQANGKGGTSGTHSNNLLRVEVSTNRMRWLKDCHVKTLDDLTKRDRIYSIIDLLTTVLNKTVFIDIDANMAVLSDYDRALYGLFRDRDKWLQADKRKRYKMKNRIPLLLKKCNAFDYATLIKNLLVKCWSDLFTEVKDDRLTGQLYSIPPLHEAVAGGTIAQVQYVGAIVPSSKENIKILSNAKKPKCKSCGESIKGQKRGSVFCSEKQKGSKAKRCRNQDSNKRRDKRTIIMKAKETEQYLIINYLWKGVLYSDTLHSSEVNTSKEWLDRVVSITILPEHESSIEPKPIVYNEAREYLRNLINGNSG